MYINPRRSHTSLARHIWWQNQIKSIRRGKKANGRVPPSFPSHKLIKTPRPRPPPASKSSELKHHQPTRNTHKDSLSHDYDIDSSFGLAFFVYSLHIIFARGANTRIPNNTPIINMKFLETLTVACLLAFNTPALAHPQAVSDIQLRRREAEAVQEAASIFAPVSDLWKRKGGGGGGGKGGSSGGSSSSGKGGSSSGSSGSSGYVPVSISGSGGDISLSERRERGSGVLVAGVGSSTSSQTRNRAAHTFKDPSKSAAGEEESPEEKVTSLRPRRFGGGFVGSFGGFRSSKGSSGKTSEKMVPSPIRPSLGSDDKFSKTNKISSTSSGRGSSSSNAGGSTKTGSGVTPRFGGGRYYGGGATTPYTAGRASPRGIAPVFLVGGALAVFPGLWLYGAYSYPYYHPYTFHNRTGRRNSTTNTTTPTREIHFGEIEMRQDDGGVNETKPVTCLCAEYR